MFINLKSGVPNGLLRGGRKVFALILGTKEGESEVVLGIVAHDMNMSKERASCPGAVAVGLFHSSLHLAGKVISSVSLLCSRGK